MASCSCGTRDKVHIWRQAPAPPPRSSHPKCAEQSSAHQLILSAKARRKFDAGWLTLPDAVDAEPAQKLYRYRKVPDRGAGYKLSLSSVTQRRPLMCLRLAQDCRAGNLISGPSGRGPHPYDYSVMFGSASTSNGEISPRSNLRRATSAIMAALSVQADKGGTVTRIP